MSSSFAPLPVKMTGFHNAAVGKPSWRVAALVAITTIAVAGCGSDDDDSGNTVDIPPLLFDESTGGDITDDLNNPLPIQLAIPSGSISGTVVTPDRDYVTINVPANTQLNAVTVTSYDSLDDVSFIGIQAGSVFTVPPQEAQARTGELLGWHHLGAADVGTDILGIIGQGEGAQGFTPPLEAGDYTLWIQETGQNPATYEITFEVSATQ